MIYYLSSDKNNPIIIPEGKENIGAGNEGVVYNCGGIAVKIINSTSWMDENKIEVLSSAIQPNLIHLPMAPLYDENGIYSGYVMKLINKIEMPLTKLQCDNVIKSIQLIQDDAVMLAEQQIAIKDTKLRNIVISDKTKLINVIDPDRYLTIYSPQCIFSTPAQFNKNNDYWVNRLFHSIFEDIINTGAGSASDKAFRFYMRNQNDAVLERGFVPQYIQGEINGFDTMQHYLDYKKEYVKRKNLI